MTVCSCCRQITATPVSVTTTGRLRLVCSPLCAVIVQALTLVNHEVPA